MKLPGRVSAAIEVLDEVLVRHRRASEALKDWGKLHRFAGAGDRHVIGTLVYDALRRRQSAAFASGDDTARGVGFGVLRAVWGMTPDEIVQLNDGEHGPPAPDAAMMTALKRDASSGEAHIAGDYPEWLGPSLQRVFGDHVVTEMRALAERAPIDLRINTLKATREQVLEALKGASPEAGPWSPWAVRIAPPSHLGKHINLEAEPAHGRGWFEVQDAASQVAVMLSGVRPGQKVADICAGAGGKTLGLAAMMTNKGALLAYDSDKRRLRPIFERMTRAGASCIEVIGADEGEQLTARAPFDCVMIDAPCTGTGAWRRKPETKWKLKPATLALRLKDQAGLLRQAAGMVRPGGRLIYITCSILPQENTDQVAEFLKKHPEFRLVPYTKQWLDGSPPVSADKSAETLLLTPAQHGTDGFFVAVMQKSGG
jgi:16S rRNA (cytosine967-C5)-methyltransferase